MSAAARALAVDALIGAIEYGIRSRRRWLWIASAVVLVVGTAAATAPLWPKGGADRTVVVGAKNFSEQYILARLIGDRLEHAGYTVQYRDGLGSAVVFGALSGGDIDVYVDYAGTIWANEMMRRDVPEHNAMVAAIADWAKREHDVGLIGSLGFENAYAFAMKGAEAKAKGIASLDDLVEAAPGMTLGSDLEFLERPEWAAVKRAYPLRFAKTTPYSPTFMYRALESGNVDVISAFSSDGRIAADGLTVLTDPRRAIPGYDAILMVAPKRAGDAKFVAALRPLIGRIPVEAMRAANYRVDRDTDKQTPEAAATWLANRIGR